jgi:hypothetical protein
MMGRVGESLARRRGTPLLCEWTTLPSADRVLCGGSGTGTTSPAVAHLLTVAGPISRGAAVWVFCFEQATAKSRPAWVGRSRGPLDRENRVEGQRRSSVVDGLM